VITKGSLENVYEGSVKLVNVGVGWFIVFVNIGSLSSTLFGFLAESYTAVLRVASKLVPLIVGTIPVNITFNKLLQLMKVESSSDIKDGIITVIRFSQLWNAYELIDSTVLGIT
jgi:hypothetical protein